ncbi:transcriptional regulator with XRE-family HTH domain [Polaromonas sp. CG_9.5]|uniref:helix-turn-helix domain-containing protein n=1 Tax=Polaromonas sp. CG_9.5 TaxID=3071705 RepID=UPI002DFD2082|nr:transcriptional regulator with XRE-family HTH domain [Polaromonas sp. CG_9.5]
MPAPPLAISNTSATRLAALGEQIRTRRKALKLSATVAAEAAGLSRVTLHRMEKGAPAVTMAAYLNVTAALGLDISLSLPADQAAAAPTADRTGWIPARVRLGDYPQLKQLAWHVQGVDELTPAEALSIYERNWRHIDASTLQPHERQLVDALRLALT